MNEKAVLISIRPKWCELIASGNKTVEVRKNRPKIEPPFRCYIYCTAPVKRVIGAFICDGIDLMWTPILPLTTTEARLINESQISLPEIQMYAGGDERLYCWHISNLIIYDEPLELSDFGLPPLKDALLKWPRDLKKAPQSWCYVERK